MRLFIGTITQKQGWREASGIFKHECFAPLLLTPTGFEGDAQADRRVHGGPEKALHQFAPRHYAQFAQLFPEASAEFQPGAMGENLSAPDWDEEQVCIGDVVAFGAAQIQVSQPRLPCWKIDQRFGVTGLTRFIAASGVAGWYYRVLRGGWVAPEDNFTLLERNAEAPTLAEFWRIWLSHRPAIEDLQRLGQARGLSAAWSQKLLQRAEWLRAQGA